MEKQNITIERGNHMTYEELIYSIKCGFDLKFETNNGIIIDIFAGQAKDKTNLFYSIKDNNDSIIDICDKTILRDEIEDIDFYNNKKLKTLLEEKTVSFISFY